MLHSYKSFLMITEGREEKLEKQKQKIHKFLKFEPIIDYVFDKVVDKEGTRGLKYTIWFCDKIKDKFINYLVEKYPDWGIIDLNKKFGVPSNYAYDKPWARNHDYPEVNEKLVKQFFKHYLETGEIQDVDDKLKEDCEKKIFNSFTFPIFH